MGKEADKKQKPEWFYMQRMLMIDTGVLLSAHLTRMLLLSMKHFKKILISSKDWS